MQLNSIQHLKRSLINADAHRFRQCGTAIDDDL